MVGVAVALKERGVFVVPLNLEGQAPLACFKIFRGRGCERRRTALTPEALAVCRPCAPLPLAATDVSTTAAVKSFADVPFTRFE